MKLVNEKTAKIGSREYAWYEFLVDSAKTEADCAELVKKIAGIGKLDTIDCRGYHDMDTHENYAFCDSVEEFDAVMGKKRKSDIDTVRIRVFVGEVAVTAEINPFGDSEKGTHLSVSGSDAPTVKKVASAIKKAVG